MMLFWRHRPRVWYPLPTGTVWSSSKYLNSGGGYTASVILIFQPQSSVIWSFLSTCLYLVGFMGDAQSLYKMVSVHDVLDTDDDQLYYTKLFLDPAMRVSLYSFSYSCSPICFTGIFTVPMPTVWFGYAARLWKSSLPSTSWIRRCIIPVGK